MERGAGQLASREVLVSRWSQDVGLMPATCARYSTRGQCADYRKCHEESLLQQDGSAATAPARADKHRSHSSATHPKRA